MAKKHAYTTTIRIGAAHYDISFGLTDNYGLPVHFDIAMALAQLKPDYPGNPRAKTPEARPPHRSQERLQFLSELARTVSSAHGIKGRPRPPQARREHPKVQQVKRSSFEDIMGPASHLVLEIAL